MSHTYRTKTQGGDIFYRNRSFAAQGCTLKASWSRTPAHKLLVLCCTGPEHFINIKSFHEKLFNFSPRTDIHKGLETQIDTQTHSLPNIYGWAKFLMPFLIPFTLLCLLCSLHSWRNNQQGIIKFLAVMKRSAIMVGHIEIVGNNRIAHNKQRERES